MDKNERIELSELLFPNITKTRDYYEELYPARNLPEGAMVTRFGPSPTGFVHMGSLFGSFIDSIYARQSNGVFYLRIEDTDQKRSVENGIEGIFQDLESFDIIPNESTLVGGAYGPYIQSERAEIYQTYVKDMIAKGQAYPCFMSEEELANIREEQEINKVRTGVYGIYAADRDLSLQEIKDKISQLEVKGSQIQSRIDDFAEEIGEAESNLHEKTKYLTDIKNNIESFGQNINIASAQITENENKIKEMHNQIDSLDEQRASLQKELTAITEDIVTKLDAKLKDAGYSEVAMNNAKSQLEQVLGKLRIFAEGRKNIFGDTAKVGCKSLEEGKKITSDAAEAFSEVHTMVMELEQSLKKYIDASPAFISEFLAPEGIITKKRDIDAKIENNLNKVSELNQSIRELNDANVNLSIKIDEYKDTLSKLKQNEASMSEQLRSTEEKISMLKRSIRSEEINLKTNEDEIYTESKRMDDAQEQIESIQEELAEIDRRGAQTAEKQANLYKQIDECNNKVSKKDNDLKKKQELQNKFQGQYEQLSISLGTLETEIKNLKQNFLEQYSSDLMDYEEHMYTITTPIAKIKEDLAKAKEVHSSLGQINYMAPEEFAEVKERYERQEFHYNDTLKSLNDLVRVSEEIKAKSSDMFLDTYNKIKKNFHNMFRRLFNGGHAELRLEDPTNILTTGIEILAQPPGKKLENIALLSGGEKTMTAIALLFATYQVRPSPFCLLDEIDAALDDKNVLSFVTALRSFANISQYIVITHNKKTVMGVNTMLGVTMEESGISKIIALRLEDDIEKIRKDVLKEDEEFVEEDVPPEEGVVLPQRPLPRNKQQIGENE